jgi:hypothetical protein
MTDSEKFVITSDQMLENMIEQIASMYVDHGWLNVEVRAGNRTLSQNSLYWMWVDQATSWINDKKRTDFKTEEIHERMKHQFLGYTDEKQVGGICIPPQLKSTAKLTKGDMYHYMRQVDGYWAGLGLLLVTPDDSIYAELKRKDAGR